MTLHTDLTISLRQFLNSMENVLDMAYKRYERVVLMGDHNVDLLTQNNERNMLLDFYDAFDLKNIIQDTKCHVGDSKTLIDHIFTNKPRRCLTKGVLDNGNSDVHRLINTVLPGIINAIYNQYIIHDASPNIAEC